MRQKKMTKVPVLCLQCDWDTILSVTGGQVWVSSKFKDEPSVQGTIKSSSSTQRQLGLSITEGFQVDLVSPKVIKISHLKFPHSTYFLAPLETYPTVHKKSVVCLSITSIGLAISACTEDNLLVWDTLTSTVKHTLKGHIGEIYRCRFFPSEQVILTCGADMRIKIWSAESGVCPVTLTGHTMAVTDVAIVDRGRNIVSVSKDGTVKLWHCGEAMCLGDIFKVNSSINCCKIFDAAPSLDLGSPDSEPSEKEINTDNKTLLVGCEDGSVYLAGLRSRKIIFILEHSSAVNCLAFLSSEKFIVGCQDGKICLYDVHNLPKPTVVWNESNSAVLSVMEFDENGFFVSRADGSVVYRLVNTDSKYLSLTGPDCDPVYDMSTDGTHVFTCCRDSVIRKYLVKPVITSMFTSK